MPYDKELGEYLPLGIVTSENISENRGKLKGQFETAVGILFDVSLSFLEAGYTDDDLNERFRQLINLIDQTGLAILSQPFEKGPK